MLSTYQQRLKPLIEDLVSRGLYREAICFYKQHQHQNHDHHFLLLLPTIIKACSSSQFLHFGLQLHSNSFKTGSHNDLVVSNSLLNMYAKCSHIGPARQVFDEMLVRDTITWNSIITCYVRNGEFTEAIDKFKQMYLLGFELKPELIASILSLCGRTGHLRSGKEIHARISRDPCTNQSSNYILTALLGMYSRCFEVNLALRVFDQMKERNEVSWNAAISGCATNEIFDMSIQLFRAMQNQGIKPKRVTLVAILPACAEFGALRHGKQIHAYAFRHGFESESYLQGALLDMYCKCGPAASGPASAVFDTAATKDVVMWTSMIGNYSRIGDHEGAMKLFYEMQMDGIKPNSVTLLAIVGVCTAKLSLTLGQGIHGCIVKSGFSSDVFLGSSLIDMYAKCGCLDASNGIFIEMPAKDSVSWTNLIRGYGLHGHGRKALQLFHEMLQKQIRVDEITILAVLSACNNADLIKEGEKLFNQVIQDKKITLTVEHYSCYIDILGRSGRLEDACEVIRSMPVKPCLTIWSSLVSACRIHGRLEVAEMLARRLIDLEPENAANYTVLHMVCVEVGNWHGAEEVRRLMKIRGLEKSYGCSRV